MNSKEIIKNTTQALGVYKPLRRVKNAAYIALRDQKQMIHCGIRHLFKNWPVADIVRFSREFDEQDLLSQIECAITLEKEADPDYKPGFSSPLNLRALYIICRHLQPQNVIETGVASGASSLTMLTAMKQNGHGTLHSIDLPPTHWALQRPEYGKLDKVSLPRHKTPGWLVNEDLKSFWRLTLGDSRIELEQLLNSLKKIQLFYHDAEHTYEAMLWEYKTVWPFLSKHGVLTSDDIGWNDAFSNFSSEIAATGKARKWFGFGLIQKY